MKYHSPLLRFGYAALLRSSLLNEFTGSCICENFILPLEVSNLTSTIYPTLTESCVRPERLGTPSSQSWQSYREIKTDSTVSFFLTAGQSRLGASGAEGLSGSRTIAPSPIRSMDSTGLEALMGRTGGAPEAPVEYKSAP